MKLGLQFIQEFYIGLSFTCMNYTESSNWFCINTKSCPFDTRYFSTHLPLSSNCAITNQIYSKTGYYRGIYCFCFYTSIGFVQSFDVSKPFLLLQAWSLCFFLFFFYLLFANQMKIKSAVVSKYWSWLVEWMSMMCISYIYKPMQMSFKRDGL